VDSSEKGDGPRRQRPGSHAVGQSNTDPLAGIGRTREEGLAGDWQPIGGSSAVHKSVPRPPRDVQPVRDILCGPVVSTHRGHGRPGEVVVQHYRSRSSLPGRRRPVRDRSSRSLGVQ
jgi:hypothetical protein